MIAAPMQIGVFFVAIFWGRAKISLVLFTEERAMRKLVILAILFLAGTSWAGRPFLRLQGVAVKSGFSHELDSAWNYKTVNLTIEAEYKIYRFLDGYTYLTGQTGWLTLKNLPGGQGLQLKRVDFYAYPNLIVGQGLKISKSVTDLFELSAFAEIYASLHTAVVRTDKVLTDAGAAVDAVLKKSYDTNLGTFGLRVGGQAEIPYKITRFRLALSYEYADYDVFTSPKMWSLREAGLLADGRAPNMSELDYTSGFLRAALGVDVGLKKWLKITAGGAIDLGKSRDGKDFGLKVCGYGFYAGAIFVF